MTANTHESESRGYAQTPPAGRSSQAMPMHGYGMGPGQARQQASAPYPPQAGYAGGYAAHAAGQPAHAAQAAHIAQPYYQPPATSVPQQMPQKKRGAGFWVALIIAVLALLAAVVLAFIMLNGPTKSARSGSIGQLDGKSAEEIQAELDRIVEDGMFNISIAALVEFQTGTSEGDLRIENVPSNPYLMQVEIQRQDTGERIYQTDVIEQNHHIQSDTLDVDLEPGTYECIATFHALDPTTEEEVGQAAAAMTIRVLG